MLASRESTATNRGSTIMPKLDGILETALYTDDMERARAFYEDVLELAADLQRQPAARLRRGEPRACC